MAGASLTNVTNGKVLSAVDSALVTDQEMSPTPDIEADIEKAKVSEKPTNGNVNPAVAPRNPDAPTSKATARQTLIKPASSKPPRPGTIVKTTKPQATKPEVPAKPASSFNSNGGFVVPPKPVRKSFPSNLDGTGEKVKKRSSSKLSRQSLPGSSSTPSSTAESTSKPTKKPASKITKGSTLAPGTSSQGRSKSIIPLPDLTSANV
ncbi:hypothetical protein EJ06DRAFT_307951 [Trichodelitschia bisporula]|uniref:Uncharacterized protein n=1 Tax=Trichodelitschia bisporula TaxID=703511 RepID=A0A6G1I3I0_9PEZI|nr:hypothetical protein EJ06DRAFT_307951 [Trichodelitschia bisporula]